MCIMSVALNYPEYIAQFLEAVLRPVDLLRWFDACFEGGVRDSKTFEISNVGK